MTVGKRDLKEMSVVTKRLQSKKKADLTRRDIQDRIGISYRYSSWESIKDCPLSDTVLGRGPA